MLINFCRNVVWRRFNTIPGENDGDSGIDGAPLETWNGLIFQEADGNPTTSKNFRISLISDHALRRIEFSIESTLFKFFGLVIFQSFFLFEFKEEEVFNFMREKFSIFIFRRETYLDTCESKKYRYNWSIHWIDQMI